MSANDPGSDTYWCDGLPFATRSRAEINLSRCDRSENVFSCGDCKVGKIDSILACWKLRPYKVAVYGMLHIVARSPLIDCAVVRTALSVLFVIVSQQVGASIA